MVVAGGLVSAKLAQLCHATLSVLYAYKVALASSMAFVLNLKHASLIMP
jgi:hypothetical protein